MKKLTNNFHLTFEPDRLGLSALLRFIKNNETASVERIVIQTGIPSGKNSGKVIPFIQYLSGMGLISYSGNMAKLSFKLTKLGDTVIKEDPLMNTNLTQWLLHANMCNPKYGSDIWLTFFDNWKSFEIRDVNRVAKNNGIERKKYTPLLNMYLNENCYGYSKIFKKEQLDNQFSRIEAPLISEFFPAYGAMCIYFMNSLFINKKQISINEFENISKFSNIFGWNIQNQDYIYENMAAMGYIKINSLVSPKSIQPLISVEQAFEDIYMNVM